MHAAWQHRRIMSEQVTVTEEWPGALLETTILASTEAESEGGPGQVGLGV
jgi:hypothetical protein